MSRPLIISQHCMQFSTCVFTTIAALTFAPHAPAQCDFEWRPGEGIPGVDGVVRTMTTWDPDGPGPQTDWLVAGGTFSIAGNVYARSIAAWDGATWHPLGMGIGSAPPNFSTVWALAVYDGALIAGGSFASAGEVPANRIARWDGSAWQPLGSGMGGEPSSVVFVLGIHNGYLIAAGRFTTAGGISANNIARWNGTEWQPLGNGLSDPGSNSATVQAVALYNGDLIAAGSFTMAGSVSASRIARWDGTTWHALGSGIGSPPGYGNVNALLSNAGELIVGGNFSSAGGIATQGLARWDGLTWYAFANGYPVGVTSLAVYNDEYYVGSYSGIARFDGTSWEFTSVMGDDPAVFALANYDGNLIIGGGIFSGPQGTVALNIAGWNGSEWRALGTGMSLNRGDNIIPSIHALCEYNGELVAGGAFDTAGDTPAHKIARWDGTSWQPLGSGITGAPFYPFIQALANFNGDLIAGGFFSTMFGGVADFIARWDGATWHPLDMGTNGGVLALRIYNGDLIAGGSFTTAGGISANGIARWDGIAWQPIGTGFAWATQAITVFEGDLIRGGANGVHRWNGLVWQPLGSPGWVVALVDFDGYLIAGTRADSAGAHVKKWNGNSWDILGTGVPAGYGIAAFAKFGGDLIAAGGFGSMNGETTSHIARWDGANWHSLGQGIGGEYVSYLGVGALLVKSGELVVGGEFISAGDHISAYIARWGPTCPGSDLNCDQSLTIADIPHFAAALIAPFSIDNCLTLVADINHDGALDGRDIQPFVTCLLAGVCP